MAPFNKALDSKAKMPEKDLNFFRNKIVGMAAAKRKPQAAGSNAQTTSYGKAMKSAMQNTSTFGMPSKPTLVAKK